MLTYIYLPFLLCCSAQRSQRGHCAVPKKATPQTSLEQDWRPAAPLRTRLEGGQFVLLSQGQEVLAEGQEVLTAPVAEAGTEIMPLCKQAK